MTGIGFAMASAGRACSNTACTVLVYADQGTSANGQPFPCPGCREVGFMVRFGVQIDEITEGTL